MANMVLLKNLPHWRADTIRPYADGATELPSQKYAAESRCKSSGGKFFIDKRLLLCIIVYKNTEVP